MTIYVPVILSCYVLRKSHVHNILPSNYIRQAKQTWPRNCLGHKVNEACDRVRQLTFVAAMLVSLSDLVARQTVT